MAHLCARLLPRRHRIRRDPQTPLAYIPVSQDARCTAQRRHTGPSSLTLAGSFIQRYIEVRTLKSLYSTNHATPSIPV